ncbi:hypothetical protein ACLB2K_061240 [Fragaria x ananassa]
MDVKLKLKSVTAITAFIGEKAIFIAADGKSTSAAKEKKGEISSGCCPKMLGLTKHIMVTLAGDLSEGIMMICNVAVAIMNVFGRVGMSIVRKLFQEEMQKWKQQHERKSRFPTTILVFGYRNRIARIYHVGRNKYLKVKENGVYGCGSGFKHSKPFMEEFIANHDGILTTENVVEGLLAATAVATLRDPASGGYAIVAALWRSKKKVMKLEKLMLRSSNVVLTAHLVAKEKCNSENPDTIIIEVLVFNDVNTRASYKYYPGDDMISWSGSKIDYELFVPRLERIARLCQFLTSIPDDY